jgi:hypothetical protein
MSTTRIFKIVDGPVGSFKTTSLLNDLRQNPRPATIATQTNALSDQYEAAEGVAIEMICRQVRSNDEYVAASKTYRERLESNLSGIYAVNQKVALACQDSDPNRAYFFDEIPSIFETFKFNSLPLSQDFVSGWLASALSDTPHYYEMAPTQLIRDIAVNSWKDDVLKDCENIITVAQRIASPDYRVYVHAKSFNAFKNGLPKQIQFFVVARPSLFPMNTTFIGANFPNSLVNQIWSVSEDVEFVAHPNIKAKHLDLSHKAGLVRIRYVSERNFSKKLFSEKGTGIKAGSPTTFPKIAKAAGKAIAEHYSREKFIYCTNTMYERTKWAGPKGTLISSNSRGYNGARDINMAVYFAAIDYDAATFTFLKRMFGIDAESAKYALTFESAYQFAGRTSLRMASSEEPVTLIFGDRATANAIASFIPGCEPPTLLDLGIPELLFEADEDEMEDDDHNAVQPVQKTAEEVKAEGAARERLNQRRKRILDNHEATTQYDGFQLRFWEHFASPVTVEADPLKWDDLLQFFQEYVEQKEIPEKNANLMFREGIFFDNQNHLLKDNILSTKIIILDIDKVTGDIKELSDYLKSRCITNYVVSTYSCVNVENYIQRDVRVRVFVPLNEAVDAENYNRIIRLLNQDIRAKFDDQFVIDPACMSINNRFFAPCRPAKGEPIFIDGTYYEFDAIRFVKKAPAFLDAQWFMRRNLPEDYEPLVIKRHTASGVRKAADEIVIECAALACPGNGDKPFYNAAVELVKAGYSQSEAIAALQGKEKLFGSGSGRDAERAVTHAISKQYKLAA